MKQIWLLPLLLLPACDDATPTPTEGARAWRGKHVQTLRMGADDNSEIIKLLPGGERAVLVASKTRKITLLAVSEAGLEERRSLNLFPDDASESELTHIDFDSAGRFAVVTRTLPVSEGGTLTDCGGSLVFVDVTDSDAFGTVLSEVAVGPMPDGVDISDDDRWVVSADEVDFNDGKCPLADKVPGVSVLELPGGDPSAAVVRGRITLADAEGAKREPEQIIFARDNDTVGVTLQDTHEVLIFKRSELLAGDTEREGAEFTIVRLPDRPDGAEPWPDGIHRVVDAAGVEHFVVAGEFNDTLHALALDGRHEAQVVIDPAQMPGDLPRNAEDWSKAPFRPDSLAPFTFEGHSYVAASLKHAGAVGVWRFDDVQAITLEQVVKIGADEQADPLYGSSLGTEGISAAGGRIVTANEDESSASLIVPLL